MHTLHTVGVQNDVHPWLLFFRHLQADGWKIVSAADDKTLKVHVLISSRLLTFIKL